MVEASGQLSKRGVRILAVVEGTGVVSGPSKNLFEFRQVARGFENAPPIELLVATFQRRRHQVPGKDFLHRAERAGIPIHCIPEGFLFDPRILAHLRDLVRDVNPDVIQSHAVKSHFVIAVSQVWKMVPWIAFHHGYTNTLRRSSFYNHLDRWSFEKAAKVVTVSQSFQEQLVRRGLAPEKITVLHNGVRVTREPLTPSERRESKQHLGISPDEDVILAVGRLSREKGHIDLVTAFQMLRQIRPGKKMRLVLAGDGPEKEALTRAADAGGFLLQVSFTGHVANVGPYYQAADVVAIPSLSEGSPNVLLEAMAAGVPVVATRVGGIPEIVRHGETALLVPARQPEAMAKAIAQVLADGDLANRLAQDSQAKVANEYSPERRAASLLNIYSSVVRSAALPSPSSAPRLADIS